MRVREKTALIKKLNAIAASPCFIKYGSGHYGPFSDFDAASEYRSRILGSGVIYALIEPTDNPEHWRAGQLQG